ncbi:DUF1236 domain-containing protein [Shinella sp. G-2]|uniref:DUF1236 domain-containing protein n=1 Tax=Shinella sp. G-2 TaxID=3133141 RepID=UPI003D0453B8
MRWSGARNFAESRGFVSVNRNERSRVRKETIAIGKPLPKTVVLTPSPEDPAYAYAVVNKQRVIADPVVQVINRRRISRGSVPHACC